MRALVYRLGGLIGERLGWLIGAFALLAWMALLWAMFGDVL